MFYGEHQNALDEKHRVAIPAPMRREIQSGASSTIYITKGLEGNLFLFTEPGWQKVEKWLQDERGKSTFGTKESRRAEHYFYGSLITGELDGQGRIKLPDNLRAFAGLESEVVFVGCGTRIELWSPGRWKDIQDQIDPEDLQDEMEKPPL